MACYPSMSSRSKSLAENSQVEEYTWKGLAWLGCFKVYSSSHRRKTDHQHLGVFSLFVFARSLKLNTGNGRRVWRKSGARAANIHATPEHICSRSFMNGRSCGSLGTTVSEPSQCPSLYQPSCVYTFSGAAGMLAAHATTASTLPCLSV